MSSKKKDIKKTRIVHKLMMNAAVMKIVWGKNIISYMHYETTYFAVTHLLDRIKESFYSQTNNS